MWRWVAGLISHKVAMLTPIQACPQLSLSSPPSFRSFLTASPHKPISRYTRAVIVVSGSACTLPEVLG
jgi:hypothetical protein